MAVEAHGGTIGIDSKIGEGTTFWFTLPSNLAKSTIIGENKNFICRNHTISGENFSEIEPYLQQLKKLKVYEVSQIQKILSVIKSLNINEIDSILQAIENAAYSVNQEEYDKLINLIATFQIEKKS